jgi:hypothetical protein
MNEEQVDAVAKVLAKWNPLGTAATEVPDLAGYRIEAGDIIFGLKIRGRSLKAEQFVADVSGAQDPRKAGAQSWRIMVDCWRQRERGRLRPLEV